MEIILTGKVVHGAGRGKELGFPTANMAVFSPRENKLPQHGVWAAEVYVRGKRHLASANIGCAKTFGSTTPTVEPHILDFADDIYGQIITLILHRRLRPMKRFRSVEALKARLKKDVHQVREFFRDTR